MCLNELYLQLIDIAILNTTSPWKHNFTFCRKKLLTYGVYETRLARGRPTVSSYAHKMVFVCSWIKDADGKPHLLYGIRTIYQTPENNPNFTLILIRGEGIKFFAGKSRKSIENTRVFWYTLHTFNTLKKCEYYMWKRRKTDFYVGIFIVLLRKTGAALLCCGKAKFFTWIGDTGPWKARVSQHTPEDENVFE